MSADNTVNLSLQLPLSWWRRLQRVSESCYASPDIFVREVLEAEVVRREMLLEQRGELAADWIRIVTNPLLGDHLQ